MFPVKQASNRFKALNIVQQELGAQGKRQRPSMKRLNNTFQIIENIDGVELSDWVSGKLERVFLIFDGYGDIAIYLSKRNRLYFGEFFTEGRFTVANEGY